MGSGPARAARASRRSAGRHRALAALLVLGLALTVTAVGVLIAATQEGRRQSIVQRFDAQHATATKFIEAYVRQIETHQTNLANRSLSGRVTQRSLDQLARLNQLTWAALYDGDGHLLVRSPAGGRQAMTGSERAVLESAFGAIPAVTAVTGTDSTGSTGSTDSTGSADASTIAFAVPIQTPTGPRAFFGRYSADDTLLRPFVANALASYRTGQVYLVTSSAVVIVANRRDDSGRPLSETTPDLARAAAAHRQGFIADQGTYFVSNSLAGTDWRLIFTLDTGELFGTITPAQSFTPWLILAGFFVMGLGLIRLFVRALTGRARAEDARTRQEAILDAAGDAFIGLDDAGRITDWNPAATELLGWSRAEVLDRGFLSLGVVPGHLELSWSDLDRFLRRRATAARQSGNLTIHHRDGHPIPIELAVARTPWEAGWRVHAFLRNISERLEHERQLNDLALTDPLTGLANRRAFIDQLDRAHARYARHQLPVAVLYADVDQFKSINDDLGHAAGDAVLTQLAARLRAHFRAEDTVGRLGGDEFAVIFEASIEETQGIVVRLRRVLAEPYEHRGHPIIATVSIGLAFPDQGESATHLLERADQLMYSAKHGRQL